MKNVLLYLLTAVMIVALYGAAFANTPDEPAGKKVFTDAKCSACHSVQTAGIEAKMKKKDTPDLGGIVTKKNAELVKKYLVKQEKINDKNHPAQFKGTPEELAKLVEWLGTVKEAPKK
ncbi:MAG: cytochrome c [Ignavibacteria bacterium]|nr:cytochrome c [Ignavibacteria bacterium]